MPRPLRTAPGGFIYHVLNRANSKRRIFHQDRDYLAFERVMAEVQERNTDADPRLVSDAKPLAPAALAATRRRSFTGRARVLARFIRGASSRSWCKAILTS